MKVTRLSFFEEIPANYTGIIIYPSETKHWFKEGKPHRENGPAVEYIDGTKFWYKNGMFHREDGPAIESSNGSKEWALENRRYVQIVLKDQIILDEYEGKYGLVWYKILGEDKIIEYPDIPGLIKK